MVFIGAYTSDKNKGISMARLNMKDGTLSGMKVVAETPNPTFLELHPSGKFLYAINEIGNYEGTRAGSVCAFAVNHETGELTLLNRVSSKGNGPCHISVERGGRMAMVANYGGGSVASYKIEADGKLSEAVSFFQHEGSGPVKGRQAGPHGHSINPTPDGRYAVACDLGIDEIKVYKMKPASGELEVHRSTPTAPGAGPRHFAWHPNGVFGYAINELNNTVTGYHWYADEGNLEEVGSVSTLAEDFKGENSTAEVRVHPSGKWVYGSNRGDDSIVVFDVDRTTGKLTRTGRASTQGVMPRNFFIEPSGRYLMAANQKTDNVVVFAIDKKGQLKETGGKLELGGPVCLRVLR